MTPAPASIASSVARAAASRSQSFGIVVTSRPSATSRARYAASCSSPLRFTRSAWGFSSASGGMSPRASASSSCVRCSHSRYAFRSDGEKRMLPLRSCTEALSAPSPPAVSRRSGGVRDKRGAHRVDLDGLLLALELKLALRLDGDALVEISQRVLVDQDRAHQLLRLRLEPSCDVDCVANAGVGRAVQRSRVARDHAARRDADADLDLHLAACGLLDVEEPDQLDHLAPGEHRTQAVVLARDRRAEDRHQAVTDHLVDDPA